MRRKETKKEDKKEKKGKSYLSGFLKRMLLYIIIGVLIYLYAGSSAVGVVKYTVSLFSAVYAVVSTGLYVAGYILCIVIVAVFFWYLRRKD